MQKYHIIIRVLHWLLAILILAMLILGFVMTNVNLENKFFYYNIHKSFGVIILALMFMRLFVRLKYKAPKLPFPEHKIERKIKNITFFSFYILLILLPISGWLMSNSNGYIVKLFNINLPYIIGKNEVAATLSSYLHKYIALITSFFIFLHIFAVIKHLFYDKKNIIRRIC